MPWIRREREAHPVATSQPPIDDDSPVALRATMRDLNRYINQNSGRLPARCVVTARQVTDVLHEVVDTSAVRELDIYVVVSVKSILNDYLPTTLKQFLALDPGQLNVRRPSGRTAIESLNEQIDALSDAATTLLAATHAQDADALMTQGSFLRTKFSGSDLDL